MIPISRFSNGSSIPAFTSRKGAKLYCWKIEPSVLTLRLSPLRETNSSGNNRSRKRCQLAGRTKISRFAQFTRRFAIPASPSRHCVLPESQCDWAAAQSHWLLCVLSALDDSLPAETPRPDHARRAVDVNRPVTPRCVPVATLAARLRTVTEGLTSPARLDRFLWSCKASGRCQSAGNTPVRSGCGDGGRGRTVTGGLTSPLALTAFCRHARRAVDVDRPVTPRCVPVAAMAARGGCCRGLTFPARLDRFFVVMQGERSMSIGR
jgi:hypothetical protein